MSEKKEKLLFVFILVVKRRSTSVEIFVNVVYIIRTHEFTHIIYKLIGNSIRCLEMFKQFNMYNNIYLLNVTHTFIKKN